MSGSYYTSLCRAWIDHEIINIPSEEERLVIMKLLEGKKCVNRYKKLVDGRSKVFEEEYPIEFYQIKLDETSFGKLKAEKI